MSTENIESQHIREVAEWMPDNFTVHLPLMPVDKWLDGTIEKTTTHMKFVEVNLADLLGFIADMVE